MNPDENKLIPELPEMTQVSADDPILIWSEANERMEYVRHKNFSPVARFVYTAYADDDQGNGFTNDFDPAKDFIAFLTTNVERTPPVQSDFAGLWKKYKGDAATVDAGDTNTLPPGQPAKVTNVGDTSNAIFEFDIPQGVKGDTGASIVDAEFSGNNIVFTKDDATTVVLPDAVNVLKGPKGDAGDEVELRRSGDYIQWKYITSGTWTNLVPLADLKGDKGDDGEEVELRTNATHIQWRLGTGAWQNLIALADLKGDKGDTGASIVSANWSGDDIVFTRDDATTVTLEDAKTELEGPPGPPGPTGDIANSYKGDWVLTTYFEGDLVTHNGTTYIANDTTNGTPGVSSDWDIFAAKGADGQGAGDMIAAIYDPAGGAKQVAFESDLGAAAYSNDYDDLDNKPTLGTMSEEDAGDYYDKTEVDNALGGKEGTINTGTLAQYFRGDKSWADLPTAVRAVILTGLNITGGTIQATDTIVEAFGKAQNQINSLLGGVTYEGIWNANTNTPSLASGVGTKGHYYVVTVEGSTNLDGITDWKVGDWAIFNGATWDKVDNTDAVVSVNGKVGAVSLTKIDIGLGNVDNTSDANKPISTATQNALNLKANANATVNLTGNQTVGGVKTFSASPVVPTPTADMQAATKKYADDGLALKVDKRARNTTTSAGSLTPNLTTNEYQEYTALAAAFTLNAPTGGVAGDNFHLVVTATGANRNIAFNASYQFLENNDAPTELELGFTYDFVITKTDSSFIISWGRVEN